jgi:hypothetical protein
MIVANAAPPVPIFSLKDAAWGRFVCQIWPAYLHDLSISLIII